MRNLCMNVTNVHNILVQDIVDIYKMLKLNHIEDLSSTNLRVSDWQRNGIHCIFIRKQNNLLNNYSSIPM